MGGILGKKGATFLLRTVRNDDFYNSSKPVLLLGHLAPLNSSMADIVHTAKDIGASIAIVEQRYTGTSLPTKEFSVETLKKFFTVPQAVQDVALTIAASARKYYPDVFDGAIVSSAPLKFQLEMPTYTEVLTKDFINSDLGGSSECLTVLKDAHSAIGEKLGSPEGRRKLEKTLDIHEGDLGTRKVQTLLTFNGLLTGADLQYNDPLCEEEYCNIQKICKKFTEGGATPLDMLATIYKASKPTRGLAALLKASLAELKDAKSSGDGRMSQFHTCSSEGLLLTCDSAACPFFTRIENSWLDYGTWLCQEGFGISKEDKEGEGPEVELVRAGLANDVVFNTGARCITLLLVQCVLQDRLREGTQRHQEVAQITIEDPPVGPLTLFEELASLI
ncbi:Thymus-specific serine protease [Perkinsus chesapeaki]|uniref:Thymus-specific serine protease n=1 Tax=Perkinsus chesapeaki TaxID=330153 RepID=A0A7J6LKL3_PERCH|nr:Thymus-specific serine protease [Perkinsus chesapeaki]